MMKKMLLLAAMIAFISGCGKSEPAAPAAQTPPVVKETITEIDTTEVKAKVEDAAGETSKKASEGADKVKAKTGDETE